jgi:hypothetical protein
MTKAGNGVLASANSHVQKELLQACRYSFCIHQHVNWAVAARRKYPTQHILASKIDCKSAYQQGTLHIKTAHLTATQLPKDELAIITLCLTFSGAPCLLKWEILLETICNLAN